MKINAIVAASENNVIGVGQAIPWHLPNDFKYFKQITTGHPIIMGKNTWLSLPKPLPNRLNVIISTSIDKNTLPAEVICFNNLEEAIVYLQTLQYPTIFIIGGGLLYQAALHLCSTVYLTRVHTHIQNGTAFFPALATSEWALTTAVFHPADEKNNLDHTFEIWNRK